MIITINDVKIFGREILKSVYHGKKILINYCKRIFGKFSDFKKEEAIIVGGKHNLFGIWKDYDAVKDMNQYMDNLRRRTRYWLMELF